MNIHALLSHPMIRAHIEKALAARGTHGDTILAHINPQEARLLHSMGGVGTINPKTGARQFYDTQGADGGSASTGNNDTGMGDGSGGLGGGVGGALGDAIDSVSGNFGQGWGSEGVAGGYGQSGNQNGGADHNGQGGFIPQPGTGGVVQQPVPQPPPPVTLPPAPPANIPTSPMMSQTASSNLIGSRFGALPGWATTPYQIGTAPTSYPVEGQPFGVPPGQPPVVPPPQPPVMPLPPPVPGGGGAAGGRGQPGSGGLNVNPGTNPGVANFIAALHAHGIGLGNNPLSQPQPVVAAFNAALQQKRQQQPQIQPVMANFNAALQQKQQQPQTQQPQPAQPSKVTSNGASPAHPLQPAQAGGALTGIMGSKPPQAKAALPQAKTKIAAASGTPRNR
jgi:hypothetical protein